VKHPGLDNHAMSTIFEQLVPRFNEENNEEAVAHAPVAIVVAVDYPPPAPAAARHASQAHQVRSRWKG
jgi:hypothetical protein